MLSAPLRLAPEKLPQWNSDVSLRKLPFQKFSRAVHRVGASRNGAFGSWHSISRRLAPSAHQSISLSPRSDRRDPPLRRRWRRIAVSSREAIEHAARMEVECWLDPNGNSEDGARARSVHAALLSITRRHGTRAEIINRLNAMTNAAVEACIAALQIVQDGTLIYSSLETDWDGSQFTFAEPFSQRIWGDPLNALLELRALREEAVVDQVSALLLEAALEQEERARWSAETAPARWQEGSAESKRHVAPGSLQVGEEIAHSGGRGHQSVLEARASRQGRAALSAAARARTVREARTPPSLRTTCRTIRMMLQCAREGSAPAAIFLPNAPTGAECDAIASAYENLASTLPRLGNCKIKGGKHRRALEAWATLSSWTHVLRVIGGWIRALGGSATSPRCDLCYRHRATKKRCGEHLAKSGITPAIRLARALQPAYTEMAGRIRRAGHATPQEHAEAEWRPLEQHARNLKVPGPLVRQCCILAAQLRSLYPSIGPALAAEVTQLFGELVRHATELYERDEASMASRISNSKLAGVHASALLTLRTFFVVWCANGRPYPRTAPTIYGRRHDAAHPLVRGTASVERNMAECLARQQAWQLAHAAHRDGVHVSRATVARFVAEGLSFDSIAARYGFSHETARQLYISGDRPRVRTRVKPYNAKGRPRRAPDV
jgi:hypothetical protein